MSARRTLPALLLVLVAASCSRYPDGSGRAVTSITADELRHHLTFLADPSFHGRYTASPEIRIASRYLANEAERIGLRPLMPDGSFLQRIPFEVTEVDPAGTRIESTGIPELHYLQEFSIPSRVTEPAVLSGRLFFAGAGLKAPELGWDDLGGADLRDRIVVLLEPEVPAGHPLDTPEGRRALRMRASTALRAGAVAVLSVMSPEREARFASGELHFDPVPYVYPAVELKVPYRTRSSATFSRAELRHEAAARLLGMSADQLAAAWQRFQQGRPGPGRTPAARSATIRVAIRQQVRECGNVVAWVEGRDPRLKDEYVVYGAHTDHLGSRDGLSYNGADDNGSACVALLEIGQALMIHRPKRSVILVWNTAEELGLFGSTVFVQDCPVPVERISAQINLDMICRNDPDSLYLVGSESLSTGLDAALNRVNDRSIGLVFDYRYREVSHPDRFFFRSDHYPFIQYGIPGVWLFCGTTPDYHQVTDTIDRVDYAKMERVSRLAYLVGLDIGNLAEMLPLDVRADVTTRGVHNLAINWRATGR
jgi:hypothetical protein